MPVLWNEYPWVLLAQSTSNWGGKEMSDTFEKTGLSLPVDGFQDHKMKFDDVDEIVSE